MCGYIMIPKSLLANAGLAKVNIREFYGLIMSLANDKGYCFASNAYLAKECGCVASSVPRWLHRLKNEGYIRVDFIRLDNGSEQRRIYPLTLKKVGLSDGITPIPFDKGGYPTGQGGVSVEQRGVIRRDNHNIKDNIKDNILFNTSSKGVEAADKKPLTDKIISALNKAAIMLTPTTADKLASWLGDLEEDVLVYAIEQADANGKRNAAYVEGILRRLHGEGIKTMTQVQQREEEHKSKKRFRDRDSSVYQVGGFDFDEIQRRMDEKY
jgi:DnaD/phage-associated family protein